MKHYLDLNERDEILGLISVASGEDPKIFSSGRVVEISKETTEKITSGHADYLYQNETLQIKKDERWEFLLFTEGTAGNSKIFAIGESYTLMTGEKTWMNTNRVEILELMSQVDDAYGNVLVAGLGMGVVALLCAQKESVSSVTVLESDQNIIDLFDLQLFDKAKITVLKEDVYKHSGKYEVALLDHYNHSLTMDLEGMHTRVKAKIKADVYNYYAWQNKEGDYKDFVNLAEKIGMNVYSEQMWEIYIEATKGFLSKGSGFVNKLMSLNQRRLPRQNELRMTGLVEMYNQASTAAKSHKYGPNSNEELKPDYAMYRLGDDNYWAIGLTWERKDGRVFSVKYHNGIITDLYEIFKGDEDFSSAELDQETLEPLAYYINGGAIKVDVELSKVLQKNELILSPKDELPENIYKSLVDMGFPYIERIFYYAEKPYGTTFEFRVGDLL
jgi:hypothetical protein